MHGFTVLGMGVQKHPCNLLSTNHSWPCNLQPTYHSSPCNLQPTYHGLACNPSSRTYTAYWNHGGILHANIPFGSHLIKQTEDIHVYSVGWALCAAQHHPCFMEGHLVTALLIQWCGCIIRLLNLGSRVSPPLLVSSASPKTVWSGRRMCGMHDALCIYGSLPEDNGFPLLHLYGDQELPLKLCK